MKVGRYGMQKTVNLRHLKSSNVTSFRGKLGPSPGGIFLKERAGILPPKKMIFKHFGRVLILKFCVIYILMTLRSEQLNCHRRSSQRTKVNNLTFFFLLFLKK